MPTAGWWEALWPDPAGVLASVGLKPDMEVIDLCRPATNRRPGNAHESFSGNSMVRTGSSDRGRSRRDHHRTGSSPLRWQYSPDLLPPVGSAQELIPGISTH
jgi:hypothetical protein